MDFIEGIKLSTLLKQPTEDEDAEIVLDPAVDNTTLDIIYEQLADYIHQISQMEFPLIGAISKDALGDWTVTRRPLTYDMNELVTGTGYPADQLPTASFNTASDFFESIARQRLLHLETQRNIAKDEANVIRRFTARHLFKQLIPRYTIDDAGTFRLFCDDMRPSNILIDPSTIRITAILDFEFTNSMPAQFVYNPPWWLLLRGPDVWIDRDNLDEFIARYVPRMEQFLRALEKVEQKSMKNGDKNMTTSLSTRMRESWASGRFWFDYAARTCLDMDEVYWHVLHNKCFPNNSSHVDEATMKGLDPLIERKMEQLRAYEEEYAARFPDP
ncbi:protein kinase-like domain [Pochonia chlamydosporia 170]|uniref:Protein kinase-like domain n=1 Tax=Pochonia chlamydosporia 170 TaxID=1380566 RepID=A0A179FI50_METCM|nr:protein kinase-like domain [Pochonia chlamydosporia 170]OAQ65212.2 protein kinase-like domain [Pochonia chlamydosporia 170]